MTLAVSTLGVSYCLLCGLDYWSCLPVWLLGTFAVYSGHRLVLARRRQHWTLWRKLQMTCTVVALLAVVLGPLVAGKLSLALAVAVVLTICAGYSYGIPLTGKAWRELPVLKTLIPWLVACAAIGLLPYHFQAPVQQVSAMVMSFVWLSLLLAGNVIWCDYRDYAEDNSHNVRSLPVLLGQYLSRSILRVIQLGLLGIPLLQSYNWAAWISAGAASALYMEVLLRARMPPGRRGLASEIQAEVLLIMPLCGNLLSALMES